MNRLENIGIPICGASNIQCRNDAEVDLLAQDHLDGITKDQTDCNCLPACSSISYNAEVSHTPFNWKERYNSLKYSAEKSNGYILTYIYFLMII